MSEKKHLDYLRAGIYENTATQTGNGSLFMEAKMHWPAAFYACVDISVLLLTLLLLIWFKPGSSVLYYSRFYREILFFFSIWLLTSMIIEKYSVSSAKSLADLLVPVLISNFTILGIVSSSIYFFQAFYLSRFLVFGSIMFASLLEGMLLMFYYFGYRLKQAENHKEELQCVDEIDSLEKRKPEIFEAYKDLPPGIQSLDAELGDNILKSKAELLAFLRANIPIGKIASAQAQLIRSEDYIHIGSCANESLSFFMNFSRLNDLRSINKYLIRVNKNLKDTGFLVCCSETHLLRKEMILQIYPRGLRLLVYSADYFFRRLLPRLPGMRNICFAFTAGRNRALSHSEVLGRLYYCGYDILAYKNIQNLGYFIARKSGAPLAEHSPTYGPLICLKRLAKEGRIIKVYKFRTMHPYSEFIQELVYHQNNLKTGGKFNNDFRITTLGKILRRFWLDELPMMVNLIRGDIKLVGVRPLSKHYLDLYDESFREQRTKYKPGLIPPFCVDMPGNLDEIQASEKKYLEAYDKHPLRTDVWYFFASLWNIFFRKARSS